VKSAERNQFRVKCFGCSAGGSDIGKDLFGFQLRLRGCGGGTGIVRLGVSDWVKHRGIAQWGVAGWGVAGWGVAQEIGVALGAESVQPLHRSSVVAMGGIETAIHAGEGF
jgi:hypothetical protein